MFTSSVAGYKDLFPKGTKKYEDFVTGIPSDIVIRTFIAINQELDVIDDKIENQRRLFRLVTSRFSKKQKKEISDAFHRFIPKTQKGFSGIVFGRRYILEFLLKELNHYRTVDLYEDRPLDEYNLFKAYLTVVDEVNKRDHSFIQFRKLDKDDPNHRYKLLWLPILNQWEWNEKTNIIFEIFKVLCFFKYTKAHYHSYLKEYLNQFGFNSIGQLLASFDQVNKATQSDDKEALMRKLVYIKPAEGANTKLLDEQSINKSIGNNILTISDIRKNPLYKANQRGYMIIDNNTYLKKNYRGPFFEMRAMTSLAEVKDFNTYSIEISDSLEKTCLKTIITLLSKSDTDVLHFDDGTKSVPDAYLRIGHKVFLFEYKAYFFPERLTNEPNFDELKQHIDLKFVKGDKKKKKGISQLQEQIEIIKNRGGFAFDRDIDTAFKDLEIFPIIVHQDFQFGIPGVNDYLNNIFRGNIDGLNLEKIHDIILIDLGILLDLVITDKNISYLEELIEKYHEMTDQAKTGKDFLNSYVSFDQLYQTKLIRKTEDKPAMKGYLNDLLKIAGITLEEFNAPL